MAGESAADMARLEVKKESITREDYEGFKDEFDVQGTSTFADDSNS